MGIGLFAFAFSARSARMFALTMEAIGAKIFSFQSTAAVLVAGLRGVAISPA